MVPQQDKSGSQESQNIPNAETALKADVRLSSHLSVPDSVRQGNSKLPEGHAAGLPTDGAVRPHFHPSEDAAETRKRSVRLRRKVHTVSSSYCWDVIARTTNPTDLTADLAAQFDFRQQDEKLAAAASKIFELEDAVSTLQQLLSADRGEAFVEAPAAEASVSSRIRASSSALQLEKVHLSSRRHKLHRLYEQQAQACQGLELASGSSHLSSAPPRAPSQSGPPAPMPIQGAAHLHFDGSVIAAARKRNLQSLRPHAAWEGCTPVALDILYSSILEGHLDLTLPLTHGQACQKDLRLRHLIAMPLQQHLSLQEQYHGCLASSAAFCSNPESTHGRHFQVLMGEAMVLLAVFSECKSEQFLACQSSSMLDGSKMPLEVFEDFKEVSRELLLDTEQLTAVGALPGHYAQQLAAFHAERQQILAAIGGPADHSAAALPELSTPRQAAVCSKDVGRLATSCALQQEAHMHLIRSFVLEILTPLQCGKVCAAAHPYFPEFASVIHHVLTNSKSSA